MCKATTATVVAVVDVVVVDDVCLGPTAKSEKRLGCCKFPCAQCALTRPRQITHRIGTSFARAAHKLTMATTTEEERQQPTAAVDFSYDESIFQLFWQTRLDELNEQLKRAHGKQRAMELVCCA